MSVVSVERLGPGPMPTDSPFLFAVYHLHVPWVIPIALIDTFLLSLPSRRYQSALVGIITHSGQSLFLFTLVLMLFLAP